MYATRQVVAAVLFLPTAMAGSSGGMTCGDLKAHYKSEACCGMPDKVLSKVPGANACPYDFSKPPCNKAEPQAPRDLTYGAKGEKTPKAATLTKDQANFLPLTNTHYHVGAEHKSEAYSNASDSMAYDQAQPTDGDVEHRRLSADPRPGFMCSTKELTAEQFAPYEFQHCMGKVEVGKSYEIHYVHSSAGYTKEEVEASADIDMMDDGLGGAANGRGMLNPMVVVQAQVFQIVAGAPDVDDLLHGWTVVEHENSVMYPGSTTGQSHDNEVCSPYAITWHVDKSCHKVSPASFDNFCKQMKDLYNLKDDLYPHGSRIIVDPKYVVSIDYVVPLV